MDEYDVVRVIKLKKIDRHFDGTQGVKRAPRINDLGTIVHVYSPDREFVVECVNSEGYTVWLADFQVDELEDCKVTPEE